MKWRHNEAAPGRAFFPDLPSHYRDLLIRETQAWVTATTTYRFALSK